ncbi:Imm53 family immunity protein [Kitasatospora terrestris]|uniref:Rhodanese-related sulfurtransferase n=1 Tax=Kitasatospora terrestris TaxID=258051 RepID=A0ABP9DKY7_9ACTN
MDRDSAGALDFLQSWYAEQCNEDWEHGFSIRIATLDNPGWTVEIDLVDTDLEGRRLDKSKQEGPGGCWLWSWSDGEVFSAACDERSLERAIRRFKDFAEQVEQP